MLHTEFYPLTESAYLGFHWTPAGDYELPLNQDIASQMILRGQPWSRYSQIRSRDYSKTLPEIPGKLSLEFLGNSDIQLDLVVVYNGIPETPEIDMNMSSFGCMPYYISPESQITVNYTCYSSGTNGDIPVSNSQRNLSLTYRLNIYQDSYNKKCVEVMFTKIDTHGYKTPKEILAESTLFLNENITERLLKSDSNTARLFKPEYTVSNQHGKHVGERIGFDTDVLNKPFDPAQDGSNAAQLNPRIQTYFKISQNPERTNQFMLQQRLSATMAAEKATDEFLCIDSVLDAKGLVNYRLRSVSIADEYVATCNRSFKQYDQLKNINCQLPPRTKKGRILAKTKDASLLPKWERLVTINNMTSVYVLKHPAIIPDPVKEGSDGMEQTVSSATETPPVAAVS